jgi:protein-disulfide isomerase
MLAEISLLPSWQKWLFWIIALAFCAGLILSIVSWLRICTGVCSESHNWRLFGLPFEVFGISYFAILLVMHRISLTSPGLSFYTGLMVAGGLGAEVKLIYIQKYDVGSWCPVCLSIAACIAAAALCFVIKYSFEVSSSIKQRNQGNIMTNVWKGISGLSIFILGLLMTMIGALHFNPLDAAENTIKESLAFGNKDSPIEIYLFTDWACPACRQLEPELEKMFPDIIKQGRFTFVDHAVHTETLNYSPYNVSFMIKNKPQYLKLRRALTELSQETDAPTDEQIEKLAEKENTKYQQLHFSDIALSQKYFKQLAKQFKVSKTPTLVIINRETKKGKKLIGPEITEDNILKAVESLHTDSESAKNSAHDVKP